MSQRAGRECRPCGSPFAKTHQLSTWTEPVALYVCPSRRDARATVPPVADQYGSYDGGGWALGHIDYAGNFQMFRSESVAAWTTWAERTAMPMKNSFHQRDR